MHNKVIAIKIKEYILLLFRFCGFEIKRKRFQQTFLYNEQMESGFARFKKLNLPVNTVVDIGAAQGSWSLSAKHFWPDASFVLFEPLEERKEKLKMLAESNEKFYFIPKAAASGPGWIHFAVSTDLDGSGIASDPTNAQVRQVPVTSIQDELERHCLMGPYIIKLDTHGFEVPIIEGCERILGEVSLFIIECYGFHIAPQSLLFWEMCSHMEKLGFRIFDIVDVLHRRKDGAFWQCDAFFIRKDHQLFNDNNYL